MLFRVLFFIAVLTSPASASEGCLIKQFWSLMNDACVYREGYCHTNIQQMLFVLSKRIPNFDIRDARVLYVDGTNVPIRTLANRNTTKAGWSFHVVMEYRNRIYDLDTPLRSFPPQKKEYFKGLYASTQAHARSPADHLAKVRVRVIPAETYVAEYGKFMDGAFDGNRFAGDGSVRDWRYFGYSKEAEKRFPFQSAEEYVGNPM
ncbi:MAG: hypothetical protein A2X94_17695 [Bdellovibrionales bacterium GWB1_55_8]|nr:MAG: hypothetical protein A2X94_17695 [Bdellovibrionales bacterium GWB1_55_8]